MYTNFIVYFIFYLLEFDVIIIIIIIFFFFIIIIFIIITIVIVIIIIIGIIIIINNNEIINNLNSKISATSNTISLCKKCQLINKRKLGRFCSHYYHFFCVTPKLTKRISSQLKNWFCSWCLKTKSQLPLNADPVATPVNDISIKSLLFLRRSVKIPVKIPKAARSAVFDALSSCILEAVNRNDNVSWSHLFCFAPVALGISLSENDEKLSLVKQIKRSISLFKSESFAFNISDVNPSSSSRNNHNSNSKLRKAVSSKLA